MPEPQNILQVVLATEYYLDRRERKSRSCACVINQNGHVFAMAYGDNAEDRCKQLILDIPADMRPPAMGGYVTKGIYHR